MLLRTKLFGETYEFRDLKDLLAKANEEKSGDQQAGIAAKTAAERVAARPCAKTRSFPTTRTR